MVSRRKFSSAFKSKVALAALKERETLAELSVRFEVSQDGRIAPLATSRLAWLTAEPIYVYTTVRLHAVPAATKIERLLLRAQKRLSKTQKKRLEESLNKKYKLT